MADITFGHQTGHTPPVTMNYPSQWHYVATWLMAHMGAYSPDEMNGLHWQWHQRAALRIRTAMQQHNIWDIPGSPGYQGHASGNQGLRSQDVRSLPGRRRAVTLQNGHGATTRNGFPLWHVPFAPRRGPGSPHTSGRQGGMPEQRKETRNPSRSRRRSRMPPPGARRVVFHEDTARDHGGHHDPRAQRMSSTTDPRRGSKRPRTERSHIPTILTPAERERLAPLHTGPHRTADGASSSSAPSLPGSAANPPPGGQHATDTQPRQPAADQRPAEGVGGQPRQHPPPASGAR